MEHELDRPERVKAIGASSAQRVGHSGPLLVGRDAELNLLRSFLQETVAGGGQLVSLTGDAGMGKSALLDALAAEALRTGAVVSVVRSWEAMDAPVLWPWMQTFRSLLREPRFSDLESLQRAKDMLQSPVTPGIGGFDVLDLLTEAVGDAALIAPLVLIFDDVHAADERTLEVIEFIAKTQRPRQGLVVLAYEESRAGTESPRKASLLSEIAREGARLGVGPLSSDAIGRLFERQAGRRGDDPEVEVIARLSEGNPLFAEEAIQLMVEEQVLHRPDHSTGFKVPKGARDLIRQRLSLVDETVLELLSVASVIGRAFSVGLLTQVAELELDDVLGLLDKASTASIVRESNLVGDYAFSHILVRETLYESLTAARRMRLHRSVAEVLESLPVDTSGHRPAELAHHWFKAAQAGDPERALPYFIEAARQADLTHAHHEAARLRQRALNTAIAGRMEKSIVSELQSALEETLARIAGPTVTASNDPLEARMSLEGDFVTLEFHGQATRLRESKGLSYIRILVRDPGREFHAMDLVGAGGSPSAPGVDISELGGSVDPSRSVDSLVDDRAREEIRRRMHDLRTEIEEAEAFRDSERAEDARNELDQVTSYLSAAFGLGGRSRPTGSAAERARVSVTKAIKDALRKIEEAHGPLAEHLHWSIRTGTFCSYRPDPNLSIRWDVR